MTVERIWSWTCDHESCDALCQVRAYGLPDGWVWVHEQDGSTTHRCPEHIAAIQLRLERGAGGSRVGLRGSVADR